MSVNQCSSVFTNPLFTWKNLPQSKANASTLEAPDHYRNTVMFEFPRKSGSFPSSTAASFVDAWDSTHVKMPCSNHNLYFNQGTTVLRWSLIEKALSGPMDTVDEFAAAVHSYNKHYENTWRFEHLRAALEICPRYQHLLRKIADLALQLPNLVTEPLPLLVGNCDASVSLTQMQIVCLLANAFYSTFPCRNSQASNAEFANYPSINFGGLLSKGFRNNTRSSDQKVLCILHYFRRVLSDQPPDGVVTYSRRCLDNPPEFSLSGETFDSIAFGVSSRCFIEDSHPDAIQVNFANRFLGGGVLRGGCVQEEILCCYRPEVLLGRLFVEVLGKQEALIIEGAERFSRYTGYGNTFRWAGDFNDAADAARTRDEMGHWKGVVTVIDALPFRNKALQFKPEQIQRELNKAYCGFSDLLAPYRPLPEVVVSGHWGCGAFGGNKELKALIQLMACAQSGKCLAYTTFGDELFAASVLHVYSVLCSSGCTVGQLWRILCEISELDGFSRQQSVFEQVLAVLSP